MGQEKVRTIVTITTRLFKNYDGNRMNNNGARVQNTDNDSRMRVADKAQDKITAMDEVRRANVIVTNRNAYVAVVMENGDSGEVRREIEQKNL